MVSNALMAGMDGAGIRKVGQGMVLMFLYLLALWDGSSESFDARHVIARVGEVVVTDIETRQRPLVVVL